MTKSIKNIYRALCLALMISMVLCAIPAYATELPDGAATDTAPEEKPTTVDVVIATTDIVVGTRITNEHVKVISVPNYNIPANVISDAASIFEKYAKYYVPEGEYVYAEQFSKNPVGRVDNETIVQTPTESKEDYLIVSDYILPNTGKDVAALLQRLINENPQRTIYFPEGEYIISTTLKTSAAGKTSVSLQLADGAVIKAADNWKKSLEGNNALIALGLETPANDIRSVGSYYSLMGGTLDCNQKANGISISSGRETLTRNICITNVKDIGIYVDVGANGNGITGSSDNDFEDITIIGTGALGSRGIKLVGFDNTITNVRIYNTEYGIENRSAGNLIKNIYVYNDPELCRIYSQTVGIFNNDYTDNWYSNCVVENYAVAYRMGNRTIAYDCAARWTSELCNKQTAVSAVTPTLAFGGFKAEFYGEAAQTCFVAIDRDSEQPKGILEGCIFNEDLVDDKTYTHYLRTPVIPLQ